MLNIGMIGPQTLLQQNQNIFHQQTRSLMQDIRTFPLQHVRQIPELDGLLITGLYPQNCAHQLCRFRAPLLTRADSLSVFGVAAGAFVLGQNRHLPLLRCHTSYHPASFCTPSILEVPVFEKSRFAAVFQPEIRFSSPAPSLGILCQHPGRGPVLLRQGDILACGYVAEWTPQKEIYTYWLEMVSALKNSREI